MMAQTPTAGPDDISKHHLTLAPGFHGNAHPTFGTSHCVTINVSPTCSCWLLSGCSRLAAHTACYLNFIQFYNLSITNQNVWGAIWIPSSFSVLWSLLSLRAYNTMQRSSWQRVPSVWGICPGPFSLTVQRIIWVIVIEREPAVIYWTCCVGTYNAHIFLLLNWQRKRMHCYHASSKGFSLHSRLWCWQNQQTFVSTGTKMIDLFILFSHSQKYFKTIQ